ncbi:MAG: phage GP46 family protein [Psychromonas sp.]
MIYFNFDALTAPLDTEAGLTHAVLQSVLNHADSTKNDRARMENDDLGGCWSDEFVEGVGSRDWTLQREKLTEQTLLSASRFYEEALQWLIDESVVKALSVSASKLSTNTLTRTVILTLNDDSTFELEI